MRRAIQVVCCAVPALVLLVLPLVSSCDSQEGEPVPTVETANQPIVGGQLESGWDPVGAMTFKMAGMGYMGAFCSGTLIAPQWVMTAGHCLYESPDLPLSPGLVNFYVGPNANSLMPAQPPSEGTLHASDRFFVHPGYNPKWGGDDIALMHLAEPVEGVKPVPHNSVPFDKSMLGKKILYVGYGATNGIQQTGSGVKRSGHMSMYTYDKKTYVSWFADAGVCFGDSGGPGLFDFDGQYRVIGVNSSVFSQSGDPCKGGAVQTRVDSYAPWIEKTMATQAPNCLQEADLCWCPQACGPDGVCRNSMCETFTCKQVLDCFDNCGSNDQCYNRCYLRISPLASTEMHNLGWCTYQKCNGSSDRQACIENKCAKYLDECKATPAGDKGCGYIFDCQAACAAADSMCRAACFEKGTATDQADFESLRSCFESSCASLPALGFESSCGWDYCAAALEICMPPANCSLLGGGCPVGKACWMSPTGKYDCFPTDGIEEEGLCPLVPVVKRACEDGLQCVMAGDTTECRRVCMNDGHCGADEACREGDIPGMEGWGYCDCRDDDGDGFCASVDCDDKDPKSNPSKGEKCYDGRDNNCDGEIDEGCEAQEEASIADNDISIGHDPIGCSTSGGLPQSAGAFLLLAALLALALVRRIASR